MRHSQITLKCINGGFSVSFFIVCLLVGFLHAKTLKTLLVISFRNLFQVNITLFPWKLPIYTFELSKLFPLNAKWKWWLFCCLNKIPNWVLALGTKSKTNMTWVFMRTSQRSGFSLNWYQSGKWFSQIVIIQSSFEIFQKCVDSVPC